MTFFEMSQDDNFLVDMFDGMPEGYITRSEIKKASSYINNKGEHPKMGNDIYFKDITFEDVDFKSLKDGQWKFINPDQEIKNDIYNLQESYCTPVKILED